MLHINKEPSEYYVLFDSPNTASAHVAPSKAVLTTNPLGNPTARGCLLVCLAFIGGMLLTSIATAAERKSLHLSCASSPDLPKLQVNTILLSCALPQNHQLFARLEQFYRKTFHALGFGFTMASVPRAREIAELNSGRVDGTCGRTAIPPFSNHPHLKRVATPIGRYTPQLLTNNHQNRIQSLKDLAPGYKLAYIRGSEGIEVLQKKHPELQLIALTNTEIALKMLADY